MDIARVEDPPTAGQPDAAGAASRRRAEREKAPDLVARWLHVGLSSYAAAVLAVAAATGAMLVVRGLLDALDVALIYLLVSFGVALLLGPRSASLAAVISFVSYNFFFLKPYHTLRIQDRSNVVLLDLVVPGVDGFEVIRQTRQWSRVPVIVLSARGRDGDKVVALDLGADDDLTKPFSIDALLPQSRFYVNYLRRKIEDDPANPTILVTEAGVGYRFRSDG